MPGASYASLAACQPFMVPQANYLSNHNQYAGVDIASLGDLLNLDQYLPQQTSTQVPSLVVPQGPPRQSLAPDNGMPTSFGHGPWLWADADPSVDVFADVGVGSNTMAMPAGDPAQVNMDLDADVDWQKWLDSLKDLK